MTSLEPADYHALLAVERDRLAAIGADALANPVPHLEGWTTHSVIGHTAWVCRFVALGMQASADDPPNRASVGEPPVGAEVIDWFAEGAELMTKALAEADLDVIRPTWTGPQPGHWWLRRITHELAIHRWDAQTAAGVAVEPVDTRQSLDGIDEVLEVFVPHRMQFDTLDAEGRSIHLHTTDIDHGEWMLRIGAGAIEWEREHAKGDVAARGSASDLLLLLWGRIGHDRLEIFGDAGLFDRWKAAAAF